MGPPIGVLPRKSMACSASTRPRISGAASSCTIAVDAVRKAMLASPSSGRDGEGDGLVGRDGHEGQRDAVGERADGDGADADARAPGDGEGADQRADADDREQQR